MYIYIIRKYNNKFFKFYYHLLSHVLLPGHFDVHSRSTALHLHFRVLHFLYTLTSVEVVHILLHIF